VTPAEGLYERPVEPVNVPSGREVLVVGEGGAKDTWHYMDPVTLAQRHGARIAGALASRLEVKPTVIRVTVVPRPLTLTNTKTPGYDYTGDQIRILATAINWSEPPPKKKIRKKKQEQPEKRKKRRRLLEQNPKEMSALNVADGSTQS
jgi:siroheme synthase (precorrin-2 oxidase/ferrochelatase)